MGYAYPIDSKVVTNPNGTIDYDRAYSSTQLRGLIKSMITNGVNLTESTNLQVMADEETMNVIVNPGFVILEGTLKHFEDDVKVKIANADASHPRIDTVVARLNLNEDVRDIVIDVLQGTPSANPTAPELSQNTSTYYEVGLADILVEAEATQISQDAITDTRLLNSRCGLATAIGEIDTETLFIQLTTDFNNWFESIKGQLSDDVAGSLQMQITENKEDIQNQLNNHTTNCVPSEVGSHGLRYHNEALEVKDEEDKWNNIGIKVDIDGEKYPIKKFLMEYTGDYYPEYAWGITINTNVNMLWFENVLHIIQDKKHYKLENGTLTQICTLTNDTYKGVLLEFRGSMYIVGGHNMTTSLQRFTGSKWVTESIALPYTFSYGTAFVYKDELHILGSSSNNTYKKYHYKFDGTTWATASNLPIEYYRGTNLNQRSVIIHNDEIHLFGGNGGYTRHYKCKDGVWTSVSTLPTPGYAENGENKAWVDDKNNLRIMLISTDGADQPTYTVKEHVYKNNAWENVGEVYNGNRVILEVFNNSDGTRGIITNEYILSNKICEENILFKGFTFEHNNSPINVQLHNSEDTLSVTGKKNIVVPRYVKKCVCKVSGSVPSNGYIYYAYQQEIEIDAEKVFADTYSKVLSTTAANLNQYYYSFYYIVGRGTIYTDLSRAYTGTSGSGYSGVFNSYPGDITTTVAFKW